MSSGSLLFCRECNNMLYPKENRVERRLYYACRNCAYSEAAPAEMNNRIYVNELKQQGTSDLHVTKELILDPTLRRTKAVKCSRCGHNEAVFFNAADNRLDLIFLCTNPDCGYYWLEGKER